MQDPYTAHESYLVPAKGEHYIAVAVEPKDISGRVQTLPIPFGFSIRDAAGHSYPASLLGSLRSPVGGTDPLSDLRGPVLVRVRDGSKGLTVVFWPDPLTSPAKFAIT